MGKWIETQQIISRERNDWQQGKEILDGRLELVQQGGRDARPEASAQAQERSPRPSRSATNCWRESEQLEALGAQLADAVTAMEGELRRLHPTLPEPIQQKLQPLYERMPADEAAKARVSVAERFQNVLGILNEVNKANNEITVNLRSAHALATASPRRSRRSTSASPQAYYVMRRGEAGIGRPRRAAGSGNPRRPSPTTS